MKFRSEKIKIRKILLTFTLFFVSSLSYAIPDKPNPERLVNDFAGILNPMTESFLEDSLSSFARNTSTQIVVVTVDSLEGYDKAAYAYELGEKWGIGSKKHNNGVIVLVKPKTERERGEAFIATGYGLEGALPDVTCGKIVRDFMIPRFAENDYSGGIKDGVLYIVKLVQNEYNDPIKIKSSDSGPELSFFIILAIVLIILYFDKGKRTNYISYGSDIPRYRYNSRNNSHRRSGGGIRSGGFSDGGFSSGSGGGFGGFGGGRFGGGGGGGSW